MKAWMRVLEVTLTSQYSTSGKRKQLKFGANWREGKEDLNIEVRCNKYMSSLKDEAVVQISNLTYSEIRKIIDGKFYDVQIACGYRNGNIQTIFDGGVLYISNSLTDTKTNTVVLLCASKMVARYGQSRINLSLNSGINMYTAIKHVCAKAGIRDECLSAQLKKQMLTQAQSVNKTVSSWIDDLANQNDTFIINTDKGVSTASVSIFDAKRSNARVIPLKSNNVLLTGGYPRLTNEGLTLTILPSFAFMCGDTIKIDNSIIDISVSSRSEVTKNYGYFLDEDGHYMIFEMQYNLQNRGSNFSLSLNCKTRSLISNYFGK